MRVLIVTHTERTHLWGLIPLAWAFKSRGDQVCIAAQPPLASGPDHAGLSVAEVGGEAPLWRVRRATGGASKQIPALGVEQPSSWEYLDSEVRRVVPWWWRLVNDPMVDDLVALCRRWSPDLILWGAATFAGSIAAQVCGVRHARVLFGTDLIGRLRTEFLRLRPSPDSDDVWADWLGAHAARYGAQFDESMVRGQATVDYLPPALRLGEAPDVDPRPEKQVLPMRFIPYNGASVIPDWLRTPPTRPRIGISLGSSSVQNSGAYGVDLREVLHGAARLDVEVVATVPEALQSDLGELPDNVRLETFIPLDALAATCTAIINHGGAGTMCTVARHGIPQLIIPDDTYDEGALADRLQQASAGVVIDPTAVSVRRVEEALRTVVDDPSLRSGAENVQHEVQSMPSPHELVPVLEALRRPD